MHFIFTYFVVEQRENEQLYIERNSYYGKGNDYQTWDYYYNYYDYQSTRNDNVAIGDASGNSYIQFGPRCKNTVKALEKMGVISGVWHLYNEDEFDKIQKNAGVAE